MRKLYFRSLFVLLAFLCIACTEEEETRPTDLENRAKREIIFSRADSLTQHSTTGVPIAAEWNDLAHWDFWTALLQKQDWTARQTSWKLFPAEKYILVLTDLTGNRIWDAQVTIEDLQGNTLAEGRTDNFGKCILFPSLAYKTIRKTVEYQVKVIYDEQIYYVGKVSSQNPVLYKKINATRKQSNGMDIVFVVDANHMDAETDYLKEELPNILKQVKSESDHQSVRVGGVVYQRQSKTDMIYSFPLNSDVKKMEDLLSWQQSTVDTEFPETLTETLSKAVLSQKWNQKASARLLFLLMDASSQQAGKNSNRLQQMIKTAAKKGIRIIPITSSHIDLDTEFMVRSMAVTTNGTSVFIQNHQPSFNGRPTEPTIGEFRAEPLPSLLTRIILQYSHVQ
ncbi:VWA domain-containing protein [Rhodocytophaga rosea]|uniref:VWA domain-containing protein n=1 Tax=Rhodocytophaga rosea TaxID=2704465 RepID=A0A6C0GFH5_9BACT|nr:VWA domain-containing protein [Rhodocytophaga rosea]QHT66564.1 VWA domain-containing protein [Rhodocytophaga rosea]